MKKHNIRLHQKRTETDALAAQSVDPNNHTIPQINITDNDTGQTKVKWGRAENIEEVRSMVLEAHKTICQWKKNTFSLPRNATGREIIAEGSRLLRLYTSKTKWEPVAINMFCIYYPLMLQKPSKNSKIKITPDIFKNV